MGGEFVKGPEVIMVEVFPYATGLIILLSLLLVKWSKLCNVSIILFMALWMTFLLWYLTEIVSISGMNFPRLWLILAVAIIVPIIIIILRILIRPNQQTTVLALTAILAGGSLLYQAGSVAFCFLEDRLLLNIGSVTGIMAATVLFVCLLIKRQLIMDNE